jgi:hypothetical protein
MIYTRPEVRTLGGATRIIKGGQKTIGAELANPKNQAEPRPPYSELDD